MHRDLLAAGRAGQPVRTEPAKPRRHRPGHLRRARRAAPLQGADSGLAGRRIRDRGAPVDRHHRHRPRPLRHHRLARHPQHPPVYAGRPDLRAQRRPRRAGHHRRAAARDRYRRFGIGRHRLRARVRLDHRLDPGPRRRHHRGARRRHAMARRARSDLRGQRAAEHGHRHVGAALPANPRALRLGSIRRCGVPRPRIRLAHHTNSRALRAPVHAAVGGVRHRTHGRRPALAPSSPAS